MALVGYVDEISRAHVEGWVFDNDRPDETISVSILVNGVHKGMCLTTHARTDLALPDGTPVTGKCAFHFYFEPSLSPFIEQRVEVVETWSGRRLANGARVLPRPVARGDDGGPSPILLTSTGRTGTTLLMSEFKRHPDIVIGDHFPYEIKQIAYHAAAFRALAADADRERSTTPETMLAPEMSSIIGSNPYNMAGLFKLGAATPVLREFYQSTVPSGYATLFRGFIHDFYRTLARAQGRPAAPFFCEKADIDEAAAQAARLFFTSVKDIVIVRDPRDLLCSSIAFWKLRPDAAMAMLVTTIPRLSRVARDTNPDTIVVRYEDLVTEPLATRRALSAFLDLDLLDSTLDQAAPVPDSHRTSANPTGSIGRWRTDLTPEQVEACEAAFEPYMRQFDYAPDSSGSGHWPRPVADPSEPGIVAAEGALAVNALVENTLTENPAGVPWRQVLEVTFGRGAPGDAFTLEGWSSPERGFVWSCASKARLRLPPIQRAGDYALQITAAPFTHGTELPTQRVVVLLNGREVASATARDICVLAVDVPASAVDSAQAITLTLRFPDAARPSAVLGTDDGRMLGFSLHRLALFRLSDDSAAADAAAAPADDKTMGDAECPARRRFARDGEVVTRLTKVLRAAFERADLEYYGRTALRRIPGFDTTRFVRLILGLEAEFAIELTEDEVDALLSLGHILALLRTRLAEPAANISKVELTEC